MHFIGIDAGTSAIKGVVFDGSGSTIAQGSRASNLVTPQPGFVEQDMAEIWDTIKKLIHELLRTSKVSPQEIASVGITGQAGGTLLLDKIGKPLKMITWRDQRTVEIVREWKRQGKESTFYDITGWPLWPEFASLQLAWLAKYEKSLLQIAGTVFSCPDWVAYCLTHQRRAAASSLIGFIASKTGTHSEELFRLCGIDHLAGLFPKPINSWEIFGNIDESGAEETGLRVGTPVVSAGYDVACSAAGAHGVHKGTAVCVLGTSGTNLVVCDRPIVDPSRSIVRAYHVVPSLWLAISESMTAVPNVSWFEEQFCTEERQIATRQGKSTYEICDQRVASVQPGSSGVIFHPYASGETGPFVDSDARASFFGISLSHTRAHLLRAVYEGVGYSIRDNFSRLTSPHIESQIRNIVIVGGGSSSEVWCQIIADILKKKVASTQSSESGCVGAAMAAAVAIKAFPSFSDAASKFVRLKKDYSPSPRTAAVYDRAFELYSRLIEAYRPNWASLNLLREEATSDSS